MDKSVFRVVVLCCFAWFFILPGQTRNAWGANHRVGSEALGSDGTRSGHVRVAQNTTLTTAADREPGVLGSLQDTPMCQTHPEFCASLQAETGKLPVSTLRSLPEQIALAVYDIGYSPVLQKFFFNKLAIDTRVMFDWAARDPDAFKIAAESASKNAVGRFSEDQAKSIAVQIASGMMGRWIADNPVFSDLDAAVRNMIAAAAASTIEETMWVVETAPKGPQAALISAIFRRSEDLIDIALATRGLSKAQDRFFVAAALGIQGAVELKASTDRHSARAAADDIYQDIVALIPEASVGNDTAAVMAIFGLTRKALGSLAHGEVKQAIIQRDVLIDYAKAMNNIHPFSLFTGPGDWARAAVNWGRTHLPARSTSWLVPQRSRFWTILRHWPVIRCSARPVRAPAHHAAQERTETRWRRNSVGGRTYPSRRQENPPVTEVTTPATKEAAMATLREAAEQGDTQAQLALGNAYADGDGVTTDEAEAVKWYRWAAEQGDPEAQVSLGAMYSEGRGVTEDQAEGLRWMLSAAELGSPKGQLFVGQAYLYGLSGVLEQDKKEAARDSNTRPNLGNAQHRSNSPGC